MAIQMAYANWKRRLESQASMQIAKQACHLFFAVNEFVYKVTVFVGGKYSVRSIHPTYPRALLSQALRQLGEYQHTKSARMTGKAIKTTAKNLYEKLSFWMLISATTLKMQVTQIGAFTSVNNSRCVFTSVNHRWCDLLCPPQRRRAKHATGPRRIQNASKKCCEEECLERWSEGKDLTPVRVTRSPDVKRHRCAVCLPPREAG